MKNIFNKIWNWIKDLFTSWYTKEIDNKDLITYLENAITYLDIDKNGKTSIKDVVKTFKNIIK